ncbi:MAG: nucleotide exchange factor GrpE [Pirellulales bacterium]|nr:nucleotide exchange factor GrpE [Pirellulales bacterium]
MSIPPSKQDDDRSPVEPELDSQTTEAERTAAAVQEAAADVGELAAEKDRALRLQAEMENLRSRTAREINEERRYAPLAVIRHLLPVIDNIDRAIEAAQASSEAAGLLEGFKLVRQQLVAVLEQHACERIKDVGQPFDPQVHEAILQQPSDQHPADHVMLVTEVGYRLHDRVVRPSKVIISSGPPATEDKGTGVPPHEAGEESAEEAKQG